MDLIFQVGAYPFRAAGAPNGDHQSVSQRWLRCWRRTLWMGSEACACLKALPTPKMTKHDPQIGGSGSGTSSKRELLSLVGGTGMANPGPQRTAGNSFVLGLNSLSLSKATILVSSSLPPPRSPRVYFVRSNKILAFPLVKRQTVRRECQLCCDRLGSTTKPGITVNPASSRTHVTAVV